MEVMSVENRHQMPDLVSDPLSISVVVTCYREGELIRRALASLDAQTDRDFELIVVNDASPDQLTNEVCREIERQHRALVIWRQTNGGPAAAKNTGVDTARGDIVVPLDADDILPPNAIAAIRRGFQEAPDVSVVFGDYLERDRQTKALKMVNCGVLCDAHYYLEVGKLCEDFIMHGTSPCRKSAWKAIGGHHEDTLAVVHDVDFFMRMFCAGARAYYVQDCIYNWSPNQGGTSSSVQPRTQLNMILRNRLFYDKFGGPAAYPKALYWRALKCGDFQNAQTAAKDLVRLGVLSKSILLAAILPNKAFAFLEHLRRRR
jgi:glycosyltransferase involved in cell wall biosynthesis